MNTAVWIVVAVVVVLLLVAVGVALSKKAKQKRVEQAGEIRERAAERSAEVERSEALAQKSEADARRAQAEADAAAAEARIAQQRAHEHQGTAATGRDELDREWERANKLDPTVHDDGTPRRPDANAARQNQDLPTRTDTDRNVTDRNAGLGHADAPVAGPHDAPGRHER